MGISSGRARAPRKRKHQSGLPLALMSALGHCSIFVAKLCYSRTLSLGICVSVELPLATEQWRGGEFPTDLHSEGSLSTTRH